MIGGDRRWPSTTGEDRRRPRGVAPESSLPPAGRAQAWSIALTISSTIFLASESSIIVLSR
jgi:hypothetical protein